MMIHDDKPREACGIFGIYDHLEAAALTYFGLYALQHRGQESCGIVSGEGKNLYSYKAMWLVSDRFNRRMFPHDMWSCQAGQKKSGPSRAAQLLPLF